MTSFRFAIWKNEMDGESINSKVCKNYNTHPVSDFVCSAHKQQSVFYDEIACPQCGVTLDENVVFPRKGMIYCNEAEGVRTPGESSNPPMYTYLTDLSNFRFEYISPALDAPPSNWDFEYEQDCYGGPPTLTGRGNTALIYLSNPSSTTQSLVNGKALSLISNYDYTVRFDTCFASSYGESSNLTVRIGFIDGDENAITASDRFTTVNLSPSTLSSWSTVQATVNSGDLTSGTLAIVFIRSGYIFNVYVDNVMVDGPKNDHGVLDGNFVEWDDDGTLTNWNVEDCVATPLEPGSSSLGLNGAHIEGDESLSIKTVAGIDTVVDKYTLSYYVYALSESLTTSVDVIYHFDTYDTTVTLLDGHSLIHNQMNYVSCVYDPGYDVPATIVIRFDGVSIDANIYKVRLSRIPRNMKFDLRGGISVRAEDWEYTFYETENPLGVVSVTSDYTVTDMSKSLIHLTCRIVDSLGGNIAYGDSYYDSTGFEYALFSEGDEESSMVWFAFPEGGVNSEFLDNGYMMKVRYTYRYPLNYGTYTAIFDIFDFNNFSDKTILSSEEIEISSDNPYGMEHVWKKWKKNKYGLYYPLYGTFSNANHYYLLVRSSNGKCIHDNQYTAQCSKGYETYQNADDPDYALPSDGIDQGWTSTGKYKGGCWIVRDSLIEDGINKSFRGYCFNSQCLSYSGEEYKEMYHIFFDPDAAHSDQFSMMYKNSGDMYLCNNSARQEGGEYLCEYYKNTIPVMPVYKICTNSSFTQSLYPYGYYMQAQYNCNLYDGLVGRDEQVTRPSTDYGAWIHRPPSILTDEQLAPNTYAWLYTDAHETCPGILLDSNVCGSPLKGINPVYCPHCREMSLQKFTAQSRPIRYKMCPNNKKVVNQIPDCSLSSLSTSLTYETEVCPECGYAVYMKHDDDMLLYKIVDNTTVVLTNEEQSLMRPGKVYSYAYQEWDEVEETYAGPWQGLGYFIWQGLPQSVIDRIGESKRDAEIIVASETDEQKKAEFLERMQLMRTMTNMRLAAVPECIGLTSVNGVEELVLHSKSAYVKDEYGNNLGSAEITGAGLKFGYKYNIIYPAFYVSKTGTNSPFGFAQLPLECLGEVNEVSAQSSITIDLEATAVNVVFSIGLSSYSIFGVLDNGSLWCGLRYLDSSSSCRLVSTYIDHYSQFVKQIDHSFAASNVVPKLFNWSTYNQEPFTAARNSDLFYRVDIVRLGDSVTITVNSKRSGGSYAQISQKVFFVDKGIVLRPEIHTYNGTIKVGRVTYDFPYYFDIYPDETMEELEDKFAITKNPGQVGVEPVYNESSHSWSSIKYAVEIYYKSLFTGELTKVRTIDKNGWTCMSTGELYAKKIIGQAGDETACVRHGFVLHESEARSSHYRCTQCGGALHPMPLYGVSPPGSTLTDPSRQSDQIIKRIDTYNYFGATDKLFVEHDHLGRDITVDNVIRSNPGDGAYSFWTRSAVLLDNNNSSITSTNISNIIASGGTTCPAYWGYARNTSLCPTGFNYATDLHLNLNGQFIGVGEEKNLYVAQDVNTILLTSTYKERLRDLVVHYYLPEESDFPATQYEYILDGGYYHPIRRYAGVLMVYKDSAGNKIAATDYVLFSSVDLDLIRRGQSVETDSGFKSFLGCQVVKHLYSEVGDIGRWNAVSLPCYTDLETDCASLSIPIDGVVASVDITLYSSILCAYQARPLSESIYPAITSRIFFSDIRCGWRYITDESGKLKYTMNDFSGQYFWKLVPYNTKKTNGRATINELNYYDMFTNYVPKEKPYDMTPEIVKKYYYKVGESSSLYGWNYSDELRGLTLNSRGEVVSAREVL